MSREAAWLLIGLGVLCLIAGTAALNPEKFAWLTRLLRQGLPGDIFVERPGFKLYLPLGSCLAASLILSLIVWIIRR